MADAQPTIRNQRMYVRYQCEGSAEFRTGDAGKVGWGTVTDLALGGCYIETPSPAAQGLDIKLTLTVLKQAFEVEARVVVSNPMFGMGLMFISMTPEARMILRNVVAQLSGNAAAPEPQPRRSVKLNRESAVAIVQELVRHFAVNRTLTAPQFMTLIERFDSGEKSSS
jgi:hypothetical protein